ncbi:MAG: TrbI/VirB10 family protein [Methylobacter sp.]|nr:TrbI/VirB10 family protein [Methylobacter sp.]
MSNNTEEMSPDASPDEATPNTGVRRVNNLPMYIIVGVMIAFLIVMALVAMNRVEQQNRQASAKDEKTGNTSMFANEIAGNQKDGIIKAKPPKVPELTNVLIARPENLDRPPTPPSSSVEPHSNNDELERIRMAKMQLFEDAVKAKTGIEVTAPRSPGSTPGGATHNTDDGSAPVPSTHAEVLEKLAAVRQQIDAQTRDDPTAAYQARLRQLQASGLYGGSTAPELIKTAETNKRNDIEQFSDSGQGDRWKLDSKPEAPRTPYELRAGFVVPATLISGINSELPGQIMAQIAQNVYDTATGKYLLLPQGSRLVGTYSSDVSYGQSRVLVAWQRIVFPDGKAMDIGAMPGADSAGYAGFNDLTNNHYVRLFGSALLMSAVIAAASYSQMQNNNRNQTQGLYGSPNASNILSMALGQQLGQVTAQMISKNINIAPTLEIRPGYRFNVIVIKDLTFSKPYQAFDY